MPEKPGFEEPPSEESRCPTPPPEGSRGEPPPLEELQFRAVVSGLVQGVSYRAFAVTEARALGLAGYARNQPDGSVEVVALGPQPALERLLDALRRGPRHARVAGVEVDWNHRGAVTVLFAIRY